MSPTVGRRKNFRDDASILLPAAELIQQDLRNNVASAQERRRSDKGPLVCVSIDRRRFIGNESVGSVK